MSLIDSDTVTSNLVSRTEVRELRRLCVEGTRECCVSLAVSALAVRAKDSTHRITFVTVVQEKRK